MGFFYACLYLNYVSLIGRIEMHFQPGIELDCLRDVITIVRNGQAIERKYELVQHCCWFVGCAAAQLGGDEEIYQADLGEVCSSESIALIVAEMEDNIPAADTEAINPIMVLTLIKLAIDLIRKLS